MLSLIEGFEPRRLMAIAAVLDDGTLTITGTDSAEKISISQKAGHGADEPIVVTSDSGSGSKAKRTNLGSFKVDDVDRIEVKAGGGKDSVTLALNTDIPALIDGAGGNDDLRTNRGGVTLQGGSGNDALRSTAETEIHTSGSPNTINVTDTRFASLVNRRDAKPVRDASATVLTGTNVVAFNSSVGGTYTLASASNFRNLISATYNRLDGGKGNDTLYTRGGEDTLVGGDGDDHYVPLNEGIEARNGNLPSLKKSRALETKSRVALFGVEVIAAPNSTTANYAIRSTSLIQIGSTGNVVVRTRSLKKQDSAELDVVAGASAVVATGSDGEMFAVIYTHAGTTQPTSISNDPASWQDPLSGKVIPSRPANLVPGHKYPAATVNEALFPGLTLFTASSRLRVLMIQEPNNGKVTSYAYDESDDSVVVKEADTMTDLMVPAGTDADGHMGYKTELQKLLTLD